MPRETAALCRRKFHVTGQVQGVGFRPFVYRLAREGELTGWVVNGGGGVLIEVQGDGAAVREFSDRLRRQAPPLASIGSCLEQDLPAVPEEAWFEIRPSPGGEVGDAQVTVDTATCPDCLRELADPADPRYRYPFISCTNCGPRYTIIDRIPYDRPNTTMGEFPMCPLCAGQYADPSDRRFHAQPIACPSCGPRVQLLDASGGEIGGADPVAAAAALLLQGRIVAVKGLGGFHLACRADRQDVVECLRRRKRRDDKPFAVMVADLAAAREIADLTPESEELLTGAIRPIVIVPVKPQADLAESVSQGLPSVGVMLPYTPLHHLLFAAGLPPLVMTSGNVSDAPLVADNDEAMANLTTIADAVLLHNRRIRHAIDDSVVQLHRDGRLAVLRRGRGYAPVPIRLAGLLEAFGPDCPPVLAVGGELKSAVALLARGRVVLGEHVGDLKDARVYRRFIENVADLETLFEVSPALIAADLHPQYLSTEYALRRHRGLLPGRPSCPIVRVQHHHAHIASCLAENARTGPAIGLVCDGAGYGDDGAVWGGEVIVADLADYRRLGHLRYTPLLGSDAAAEQTWRPAVGGLWDAFGANWPDYLPPGHAHADDGLLAQAGPLLETLAATIPSSSLGRWFDAVSWLCGLAQANTYEGQAPMALEAAVEPGIMQSYPFELSADSPFQIDLRPMLRQLTADLIAGVSPARVAAKFHNTVSRFLVASARRAREGTGLNVVALSGGCFANRVLTAGVRDGLAEAGFEVLSHRLVPCNDGGVALGQAVVAAGRWNRNLETNDVSCRSRTD